jgi:hypothetical protein
VKTYSIILAFYLAMSTGCAAHPADTASPKSAEHIQTAAIHRRAVEAVIWGMPAVNYDLMLQEMLNTTAAKQNEVLYMSTPADWKNQPLIPNPDAIYLMIFFNTKEVPVVIDVPPADTSSFAANIDTIWQMALEDAGPQGADAGKGGKDFILPPGYKDSPPDGYITLHSDTFGGYAIYDRQTHALVKDLDRASCASNSSEVRKNDDGSTDVYFSHTAPARNESNWVPTDPKRQFEVLFRLYGPEQAPFEKTCVLPDVEEVK